jgi:hypothetical protein
MNKLLVITLLLTLTMSSCDTNKNESHENKTYEKNNNSFKSEVQKLYLDLNLNQLPTKVIQESKLDFEFEKNTYGSESKDNLKTLVSYITLYENHPNINSDIKKGSILIEYYEPEKIKNVYGWDLRMMFENEFDMIIEYDKLINQFEKYSLKTKVYEKEKDELGIVFKTTVFHLSVDEKLPSISFHYNRLFDNSYPINITYNPKLE